MARLIFPDEGSRLVYRVTGGSGLLGAVGTNVTIYSNAAATVLADLRIYDGTPTPAGPIVGSIIVTDAYSRLPLFWGPDGIDTVYAVVATGGPIDPVYARTDDRIDANAAAIAAEAVTRAAADATLTSGVATNTTAVTAETAARLLQTLDRRSTASSQLSWAAVGSVAYVATAVGTDGLTYGVTSDSSTVMIRSSDGFSTIAASFDLAGAGAVDPVIFVTRVAEGYVAVTTNGTSRGAMWFSVAFNGGWVKKQDLTAGNPAARISVGRPEWDATTGKTIWGVGEYSQQVGVNHHLWVSRDGGVTWIDSFNRAAVAAGQNNHMHAWAFDPALRRMWLSHGDGSNSYFAYSDDLGATWLPIVANGMPVATVSPVTLYHQPPVLIAAERFLITCPDAGDTGFNLSGVWAVEKSPVGVVGEALRVANVQGHTQYAPAPYAMSTDRLRVYMLFPQSPTLGVSNQTFVAASGDGGRSWQLVYTAASVLGDDFATGIVGPDPQGRLYISPKPNGAGSRQLYVAQEPTWTSVLSATGRLTTLNDLKGAMVQAGLTTGGSASPLDLNGGKLSAGTGVFNAPNGSITLGAGAADVGVIDTKSGTTQVRFRIGGAEIFRYDVNSIQPVAGKWIEFGTAGAPSIKSGTGSPEGVVTSKAGSLWLRSDGAAGTTLYVKQSGAGNTGWLAIG